MRRDPAYSDYIHRLQCCQCGARPVEQHHITGAGMGLRSDDRDSIPLCTRCHRCFHSASGPFKGWDKARRRAWQRDMVAQCQRNYAS